MYVCMYVLKNRSLASESMKKRKYVYDIPYGVHVDYPTMILNEWSEVKWNERVQEKTKQT